MRRAGSPLLTSTHTVISKRNTDKLVDIIGLGAELGFRSMHFIDVIPANEAAKENVVPFDEICRLSMRLKEVGCKSNVHVTVSHRRQSHPPHARINCFYPWSYILIKASGDIQSCPAVFGPDRKPVMGNILKQDFETIWMGEPFRKFRIANAEGTHAMCNLCPYY
jgi:radical SAM protein with 4Fe4S-binding SPASM domain